MHRHQYKGRKLGRKAAPRKALMRNLASQIILHEQITTTLAKAKEVRPILEKLITRSKKDTVVNRRLVAKYLSSNDKSLVKLFEQLGPLYKDRNGGYLRIVKTVNRKGDNAEMAIVQLLDTEKLTKKEAEKTESKKSEVKNKTEDKKIVAKKTVKKTAPNVAKKATVKKAVKK
jgi:large subunit ribosomal protein L17